MCKIRHLHHAWLLGLGVNLAIGDVWLKTLVEIGEAGEGVCDCHDDQDDGKNCEGGQGVTAGVKSLGPLCLLVHSDELKEEVGEAGEVEDLGFLMSRLFLVRSYAQDLR